MGVCSVAGCELHVPDTVHGLRWKQRQLKEVARVGGQNVALHESTVGSGYHEHRCFMRVTAWSDGCERLPMA